LTKPGEGSSIRPLIKPAGLAILGVNQVGKYAMSDLCHALLLYRLDIKKIKKKQKVMTQKTIVKFPNTTMPMVKLKAFTGKDRFACDAACYAGCCTV
jgi:hypothetical protein